MRIYPNQIKIWFDAPAKRWIDNQKQAFDGRPKENFGKEV